MSAIFYLSNYSLAKISFLPSIKSNFRLNEFFYRFTFPTKVAKVMMCCRRIADVCCRPNEKGLIPGKLSPFALQPSSVATYISFSRHLSKLLQPELLFFLYLPELIPLNPFNSFSINISSRKEFQTQRNKAKY